MALKAPPEGRAEMLGYIVNKVSQGAPKIALYLNDITPAGTAEVHATFTLITEPADAAVKTFTSTLWDVASTPGTASYPQLTYTFTTTATAYGYEVSNNGATKTLWAERFTGAPYNIPSGGGTIKVTSTITLAT